MADWEVQRRLAAILAADVVGYTRLMEEDTDGTVAAWQAARDDVVEPAAQDHSGRIVKLTGDGFLVEFQAVQEAVNCAIAMQQGLASSRLEFRMGVNLGDIIDDGRDIHGEGANIAARIESLAEPGGINISGDVYNQVKNRIKAAFEDRGEQDVKNVSDPVRVYAIRMAGGDEPPGTAGQSVPDKPSIAVLLFDNLSGDPEQDYFADGMVEEIITGLSHICWLRVIARNSSFIFKGQPIDIRDVAEKLGVRYVMEGSVRKAGDRVRITAQLVEADAGRHLWADRFDGTLADVFDLQDQITAGVVAAIEPSVRRAEIDRAKRKRPDDLGAYDLYLRAIERMYEITPQGRDQSLAYIDQALTIDPGFAEAHGVAAWC
jgi:adenylate cyclase